MTIRAFCKAVEAANPGIMCQWKASFGEFRVSFRELSPIGDTRSGLSSPREASAYYTSDRDDCARTARAMWETRYHPAEVCAKLDRMIAASR